MSHPTPGLIVVTFAKADSGSRANRLRNRKPVTEDSIPISTSTSITSRGRSLSIAGNPLFISFYRYIDAMFRVPSNRCVMIEKSDTLSSSALVDKGLVAMFLKLSPEERIRANDNSARAILEMRDACRRKEDDRT